MEPGKQVHIEIQGGGKEGHDGKVLGRWQPLPSDEAQPGHPTKRSETMCEKENGDQLWSSEPSGRVKLQTTICGAGLGSSSFRYTEGKLGSRSQGQRANTAWMSREGLALLPEGLVA